MPERFARRVKNLAVLVEEEPSEEARREEGLAEGETLLGLYCGVPATERGDFYSGVLPDTITLYRLPLLEEAEALFEEKRAPDFRGALHLAVRETLWHEIGHYFGLGEAEVHAREVSGTNVFRYAQDEREAAPHATNRATLTRVSMTKTAALISGAILALLGLLGFVNNPLIGANALFAADAAADVLHIVLGAALAFAALRAPLLAAAWMKTIGAIAFLLGLIGMLSVPSAGGVLLGVVFTNGASNWLHLVVGASIFLAAALLGEEPRA
jgi:predicted Zn-dependent protease with MMP-like domain